MSNVASLDKLNKKKNSTGDIDLNSFAKLKENTVVHGSNARFWFKFDDGRVLFKSYDNDLEPFGEVLYSRMASRYNSNCAKYDFAFFGEESGTISYDLGSNDNVVIDMVTLFSRYNPDHLSFDTIKRSGNYLDIIKMLNKKYNNYQGFMKLFENRYPEDIEILKNELIRIFVIDVLLDHSDRNLWNFVVVTDKYGKNAHLYSIDSSQIARLNEGEEYIKDAVNSLLTSSGTVTIEDYLSGGVYGYDVDVKVKDYNPCKDLLEFYASSDDSLKEEMLNMIKDMEINDLIEELNKGRNINPIVITWIKAVFNSRKSFLLKKFYHIKNNYKGSNVNKNFYMKIRK